ncbi:hypothetical protein E2C01_042026 [Portunus trituberculatus]|uniref:Uncharacterized protein n=1 Tax=Portunus trituberculatus TaxID=210409 RepID=A0A5B7FSK6_PORTR|nr:hypothetical protein [Portunus trituberculatus]
MPLPKWCFLGQSESGPPLLTQSPPSFHLHPERLNITQTLGFISLPPMHFSGPSRSSRHVVSFGGGRSEGGRITNSGARSTRLHLHAREPASGPPAWGGGGRGKGCKGGSRLGLPAALASLAGRNQYTRNLIAIRASGWQHQITTAMHLFMNRHHITAPKTGEPLFQGRECQGARPPSPSGIHLRPPPPIPSGVLGGGNDTGGGREHGEEREREDRRRRPDIELWAIWCCRRLLVDTRRWRRCVFV